MNLIIDQDLKSVLEFVQDNPQRITTFVFYDIPA